MPEQHFVENKSKTEPLFQTYAKRVGTRQSPAIVICWRNGDFDNALAESQRANKKKHEQQLEQPLSIVEKKPEAKTNYGALAIALIAA